MIRDDVVEGDVEQDTLLSLLETIICHRCVCVCVCVCVCSVTQLCPTLCHPMDCSPPGSSAHGGSPTPILEWLAMPSSGDLPNPEGIEPRSPALRADSLLFERSGKPLVLAGGFFNIATPGKPNGNSIYYQCCKD